ncbi:MAG TPA: hypothetical protein VHB98_06310 [Chloroflexota bacterium]|nr:hypothetical protein [Chloroflexota bacterium]
MKTSQSWFLVVMAIVVLLIAGLPNAVAARAHAPGRAVIASRAGDARFFSGHGGDLRGPFSLLGGRYELDVWARYNALYDAGNSGDCIFGAYIDGIETPMHVTLSTPIPIADFPSFHYTPTVYFPAGHYKLVIVPSSDCDWSVSILRLGPAVPAIDIVAVRSFLHRGNTFTPTSVVHWGQTINFAIFYTLQGAVSGTPAGTIAIAQHGKDFRTFHLRPWKDTDGTQQLYINLIFTPGKGATPGPAVAAFSVTVGTLHVHQSLDFTVAS